MDRLFRFRKPAAPATANPPALPSLRSPLSPGGIYIIPRALDEATGEVVYLDRVAERYARAALIGAPGAGKSAALRFLAGDEPVISLLDFHPLAPPDRFQEPPRILLDDVTASSAHGEHLRRLASEHGNSRLYAGAQDASRLPQEFVRLRLLPFHEREVAAVLRAWLSSSDSALALASLKSNSFVRRAIFNPLDIYLLIQLFPFSRTPENRSGLYDAYLAAHLKAESDPEFARRALEGIALSLKRGQLAKDDHLARGYGLLVKPPSGRIAFVHPLLHDFLAASALRRNPDLSPLLERMDDPDWKHVVLFYAGLPGPENLITTLVDALLAGGHVELAAQSLGQLPEPPPELTRRVAEPLIERAWATEDPRAVESLSDLRAASSVEFFAARIKEKDPLHRSRAARLLGRMQTDRAIESLLPQLRDPNPDVRDEVIAGLAESKHDRVTEPLLVALRGDSRVGTVDTRMKAAAARALGRLGSEKAIPALIVDLQLGEPSVKEAAASALVEIRSDLAYKPLQALAGPGTPDEIAAHAEQILNSMPPR